MSDRWDFYFHKIGESPASAFVDLGIRSEVPDARRPHLARVRLQMQVPREDGLSSSEESKILSRLEDIFTEDLLRAYDSIYVWRPTACGYREFCFYCPRPLEHSSITRALRAFPEYSFESQIAEDPHWRHYLDVLYPSHEEMQAIKNSHVLCALEKHGDNHEVARPVRHWSFFKTDAHRQAFLSSVLEPGFSMNRLYEDESYEEPFVACLQRTDSVDYETINDVVVELLRLTEDHHGTYDGWETQVTYGSEELEHD